MSQAHGQGWPKVKTKTRKMGKGKKSESVVFAKAIDFGLSCWKDTVARDPQAGDLRLEDFHRALAMANINPETFNAVESKQLVFPTSLTPLQRRLVHKGAVRLGLFHASCGSGDQRRVVVSQTQVYGATHCCRQPPCCSHLCPAAVRCLSSLRRGRALDDQLQLSL